MLYFAVSVAFQLICAIHVMRNGRNQLWLLIILFFSVLGCFAYILLEVLPAHGGNRYVRHARSSVGAKLNPEKALRAAQDALSLSDTAANRIAMGEALVGLGRYRDAIPYFRRALEMTRGSDASTTFKLAQALFEVGEAPEVLRLLAGLPEATTSVADPRKLLMARALVATGEAARARAMFEDVITRMPGDEARCHYAHFLIEQGDRIRARRLHRLQRAEPGDMYRWAESQLKLLRA